MLLPNELSGQRVLVTGGAGFIGARVVRELRRRGANVAIVDNLSVGLPMPAADDVAATTLDIREADPIAELVKGFAPDTVVHLAAVHHIPTCEQRRAYALEVNVVGTENVLAACEAAGVAQLVIASTGAVYAWTETLLEEDASALAASDNYSIAKLANETQARLWAERTGARLRMARIFNTIGPGDPNAHLIPDIMDQIPPGTRHATLRLGNLKPRRDYIHVEDTARGLVALAADRDGPQVDAFNICTGVETPVEELVRTIARQLGATLTIEQDASRVRRIDRMSQVGSANKAAARLGWRAEKDLDAAVAAIIADKQRESSPA